MDGSKKPRTGSHDQTVQRGEAHGSVVGLTVFTAQMLALLPMQVDDIALFQRFADISRRVRPRICARFRSRIAVMPYCSYSSKRVQIVFHGTSDGMPHQIPLHWEYLAALSNGRNTHQIGGLQVQVDAVLNGFNDSRRDNDRFRKFFAAVHHAMSYRGYFIHRCNDADPDR